MSDMKNGPDDGINDVTNPDPNPDANLDASLDDNANTNLVPSHDPDSMGSDEIEIPAEEMSGILSDEITDDGITEMGNDAGANPNDETVLSNDELDPAKEDTVTEDRTSVMFSLSDIQHKLNKEIDTIPDNYREQFEPEQMSLIIKDYFTHRSDAEKVKINRNFLIDAEPFKIEKLVEDIKKSPEGLATGIKSLDSRIIIPPDAVTLITARPKHGKTCFLLNVLLNMCRLYKEKHFVLYTYESPKWETLLKLINISGPKQFSQQDRFPTNLERWKYEFKQTEIPDLEEKAENDAEYSGLKLFTEISPRIHVIDSNHNVVDLADSIHSFGKAFDVGAVFIDSLPRIPVEKEKNTMERTQQLRDISNRLMKLAYETRFPLILSAPLTPGPKVSPEYDDLSEANLAECGSPGQDAGLIIGLQNYARSKYIGSNLNVGFKSAFFGHPLEKAELMPENIKDMMQKTILLAKVFSNKTGPETESELLFHKQLLKISDFGGDGMG